MASYHVKELGSSFIVGNDEPEVLICADQKIAQQIVNDVASGRLNNAAFYVRRENLIGPHKPSPCVRHVQVVQPAI